MVECQVRWLSIYQHLYAVESNDLGHSVVSVGMGRFRVPTYRSARKECDLSVYSLILVGMHVITHLFVHVILSPSPRWVSSHGHGPITTMNGPTYSIAMQKQSPCPTPSLVLPDSDVAFNPSPKSSAELSFNSPVVVFMKLYVTSGTQSEITST